MQKIRAYQNEDLPEMIEIWNEVVNRGEAFPQTEPLGLIDGAEFFSEQTLSAVSEDPDTGKLTGLYILHPNNVGRCGHIANASFAVKEGLKGQRIGESLVKDCLEKAKMCGFSILQFNAVVESNLPARKLYQKLGFQLLGTIPGGFKMKDGHFENICLYYYDLQQAEIS